MMILCIGSCTHVAPVNIGIGHTGKGVGRMCARNNDARSMRWIDAISQFHIFIPETAVDVHQECPHLNKTHLLSLDHRFQLSYTILISLRSRSMS